MSKKRRKARRPNGKRPAVVVSKPSQAQLVALAKQAGKLAARSLAQDMKKLKRGRRVKNAKTGKGGKTAELAGAAPADDPAATEVADTNEQASTSYLVPSARSLARRRPGLALGGGYGRRSGRRTPGMYSGSEVRRDHLLAVQEDLDLLKEALTTAGESTAEGHAIQEEINALEDSLSLTDLALLNSEAIKGIRAKEKERREAKARRLLSRAKPFKAITDRMRKEAISLLLAATDKPKEAQKIISEVFGEDVGSAFSNGYGEDGAAALLSATPETLHLALEIASSDFSPVSSPINPDERKWNILHRKIVSRLRAAQQGRMQNPPKRKRGRKRNPLDMGYQVRAENGRRRRKSRRSRKHNPSLSDFQLLLQGGSGSMGALLRQTAFGAGGFMLSGLAESLISGDVVSSLNLTSYLPDGLGQGKQMLASAIAAALSGVAVWGAGKGVAAVRDNAPGLYIGIGLRLIRNLVDHATRGNASMQGLRNLADLPQLGAYGCGAWNPAMNGYYNFQPVMNGYYNYQPALSGYYNYQPALSGPPEMGYQLSGSPASNPFGQPF